MLDQPEQNPPALPPIDERLARFQNHHCSITDMRDATALLQRDPNVQNILVGLGITRSDIDYNGDHNIHPQTGVAGNASNREWAATLLAGAQLTAITGKPLNELTKQEIVDCGRVIYQNFANIPGVASLAESAPAAASPPGGATCDVESPIVRARREQNSTGRQN